MSWGRGGLWGVAGWGRGELWGAVGSEARRAVSSGPLGPGMLTTAVVPAPPAEPLPLPPALEQPATASAAVTPAHTARSHLPVLPVMETP